ncbi:hypothetical protein LzC2_35920 [Planctomycetes bacterium LzC2]|uniref:Uncharacterized protein n=1 Tax=Alienimonas chondri TaxID=2681879 RepID=A0ABX1VI37_9PLAN|nr:hypothetical protein [Alienimonas chondri]
MDWARWVPEFRLLEAPRIAASPVIILLAFAGLALTAGGDQGITTLLGGAPPLTEPVTPPVAAPWEGAPLGGDLDEGGFGIQFVPAASAAFAPLQPAYAAATDLLSLRSVEAVFRGAVRLLWALIVWGFFGTVICRCAAVRFALGATGSPTAAVRLAGRTWVSALGGPLLPATGLGVLALGLILLGWAGDIPAAGPWLVAVLWGAALLAGLAAVALLVLAAVGWPLMLACLAVEGSDAFDAFSRAFSYVLGRPLRLALHVAIGVVIAAVAVSAVHLATTAAAQLAAGFAAVGMGQEDLTATGVTGAEGASTAAAVGSFWTALWKALPAAFAAGLFWTLTTVSYFLLRYADDAVETDEIWQPKDGPPADDGEVPRVGVAASDVPTIERPHQPTI